MGTLSNSVFQTLLGWIRILSTEIWNTFSSPESESFFRWIGNHWKGLTLILCAAGLVLDLIIYFFRWQPYRVWFSFLRRDPFEMDQPERVYARDDSFDVADSGIPEIEEAEYQSPHPIRESGPDYSDAPAAATHDTDAYLSRKLPGIGIKPSEHETQKYIKSNQNMEPEMDQNVANQQKTSQELRRNEPEGTTGTFDQALRPRRRRFGGLLSDEKQETIPPDQLIDRNAAYRRPVYPREWKGNQWRDEEGP